MTTALDIAIEVSEQYDFSQAGLPRIQENQWVRNQWPVVYFLQNEQRKEAYVGESTNALTRIRTHLATPKKAKAFNKISIIGSDKFNKSATLDIEANLINHLLSDGTYTIQNGNFGLVNHQYYQQNFYRKLFEEIWKKLLEKRIVTKSLKEIENSELFKYSPYKSLNQDQYNAAIQILSTLTEQDSSRIFIRGSAGTGKTILATYLIKLLCSDPADVMSEEMNEEELREVNLIRAFRARYPNAKIGLVVAMTSLRTSLQEVFRKVPGLKASMVINPSDAVKSHDKYDLLIVDEAHRLRQYRNIGWMGTFRKNNQKLGLGDDGTELDWILARSKNQIFFYDAAQSVKPSDIDQERFDALLSHPSTVRMELKSQMRVQAGDDYIAFVDSLVNGTAPGRPYRPENYELLFFESLKDLYEELRVREEKYGLCRLVAGYAWDWKSKQDKEAVDIVLDGLEFQWNRTEKDWVNSPTAFKEVGCIHTTQGYDLNYAGVIFGREIDYNPKTKKIEVFPSRYYDMNGKKGATPEELEAYIVNIYKTLMYRGIKGTFVYACNENLRDYLKQRLPVYAQPLPFRIMRDEEVRPYVNSVPLIDIAAAAGPFTEPQLPSDAQWIELPLNISAREGYFVCQVVGESMNKKIPNGSYCLFKRDEGGSREGKIVLVQSTYIQDADFGSGYTVKQYHSEKRVDEDGWRHASITLKPMSDDPTYEEIKLEGEELRELRVVGVFVEVVA